MKPGSLVLVGFATVFLASYAVAQTPASKPNYSGMYSFLKDGEFVQITIEDNAKVDGFISRYGDSANDRGTFLDQFFKSGSFVGSHLTFTTESVHGVTYEFQGDFSRGPGKTPNDEAYYVVRGTLTRFSAGPDSKATSQSRQVEFKSFPVSLDK